MTAPAAEPKVGLMAVSVSSRDRRGRPQPLRISLLEQATDVVIKAQRDVTGNVIREVRKGSGDVIQEGDLHVFGIEGISTFEPIACLHSTLRQSVPCPRCPSEGVIVLLIPSERRASECGETAVPCTHAYVVSSAIAANNDLLYQCGERPDYLSVYYHRSAARSSAKGLWAVPRDEEAGRFFCAFDNGNSSPLYAGLWHIENDYTYVGEAKELIAYFPAPVNPGENWHGYPFTFARKSPPERIKALKEVAERLHQSGDLSLARVKKIRQGDL